MTHQQHPDPMDQDGSEYSEIETPPNYSPSPPPVPEKIEGVLPHLYDGAAAPWSLVDRVAALEARVEELERRLDSQNPSTPQG